MALNINLTIIIASSIESSKIIVIKIFKILLVLNIINIRFLNPAFLINAIVYTRFGLLKGCLYI